MLKLSDSGREGRLLAPLPGRLRAYLVAGERAAAEAPARVLLAQDPRAVRSLCLLAESAAGQGRGQAAKAWLRQALAVDPYDAEARSLLERLSLSSRPTGAASRR